jgi:hypothetical protein
MNKEAKYSIQLDWKDHSVDLSTLNQWFKDALSESYKCISGNKSLKVWFSSLPTEEDTFLVNGIWDELDDMAHDMCKEFRIE